MFKIGDKVHCEVKNNNGIVTSVNSTIREYPVAVGFEDGSFDYYTSDGKIVKNGTPNCIKVIDVVS